MLSFIKKHWIAYLVGATLAVALGFGASYLLGVKWSTPPEIRAQRIEAEESNRKAADAIGRLDDGEGIS